MTEEELERVQRVLVSLSEAIVKVAQAVYALQEHTGEHHEVLNAHAQAIAVLEELMIGVEPNAR